MQLTANFSLAEMCKSYTAQRLGIKNTPNEKEIENLEYLCINISQPCRDHFGRIDTNSAFRCKELNESPAIGSSDKSFHPQGCGQDMEANNPKVSNFELLLWIHENLPYTELIAEYFDINDKKAGWVHVAKKKGDNRKMLKLKDKDHHYKRVTIEYIKELYS